MPQPHELARPAQDNELSKLQVFEARAKYKFADDGGVQGDINLLPSAVLPSGALVVGGFMNVITPPTSGGAATIAIKVEGAADLQSAAAISGAPWSTGGLKAMTKTPFSGAPIKLTAARNVVATVGAANLTAGEFEVVVFYLAPGTVT